MDDSSPEIAAMMRRMLARTGSERVVMASQMFEAARAMILASLPAGLPDTEIKLRLCERLYGNEMDLEAFFRRLRQG